MMLLQDGIEINAPAEAVFDFFNKMDENYVPWHPDHDAFRWEKGNSVAVGSIFYFEELIGDEHQKKSMRFIEVISDRKMVFEPMHWLVRFFMPRLSFEMIPIDAENCRFEAKIELRVGPIGERLNHKEFTAVRQHMREESQNIKQMVEAKMEVLA